jgi:hypothetical protein
MFQGTPLSPDAVQHLREKRPEAFRMVVTPELLAGLAALPAAGTVLIPEIVFWLMTCVALGDGTMAGAMATYWASLGQQYAALVPLEPLTPAAFCTARKLLPVEFFSGVFCRLNERFDQRHGGRYKWRGFSLVSTDGSLVDLPAGAPELKEKFCAGSNELGPGKHPQALLVGLVDIWNGLCRGFALVSTKVGEVAAVAEVMPLLRPDHLFLADRNFSCFEVMARVRGRASQFLMRLQEGRFTGSGYERKMLSQKLGGNQWLTTLRPTKELREKFSEMPEEIVVRIIQYQIPGFRPSYLITSLLDAEEYRWEDLVMLYHERWRQGTQHADWKHTLTLANLRSKTEGQIRKEVYVQLTLNNAVRWVMAEAATTAVPKEPPCSIEPPSQKSVVPENNGAQPSIPPQTQEPPSIQPIAEDQPLTAPSQSAETTPQQALTGDRVEQVACSAAETPQQPPSQGQSTKPGAPSRSAPASRKYSPVRPVDLKFLHAKRLVITASTRMAGANPADIPAIYRQLLHEIAGAPILVRRGRNYPRRKKEAYGRDKGHGKIARSARIPRQPGDENNPGFIDIDKRPLMMPDAIAMTI